MPRAIWSGAISFGLVNIPVKLYSAVQRKTVRFNQLDAKDRTRIQQKRVNPSTGEEVPYERLVKGYELSPDRYVVVTPEELEAVEPRRTRMIEIEDFVELDEIDPIYYDHPYYLAPGAGGAKAYSLLLAAMERSRRVGIARVVIRSKEQLVAIRPRDGVLCMETLLFGDEVVAPDDIEDLPEADEVDASEREVKMAGELIESLSADFDPSKYRDEYRERVLDLVERKAQGEEIAIQPPEEAPAAAPDLMAALEASIAGAKGTGAKGKKKAAASGNGKPSDKQRGGQAKKGTAAKTGGRAGKADGGDGKAGGRKPAKKRSSAKK